MAEDLFNKIIGLSQDRSREYGIGQKQEVALKNCSESEFEGVQNASSLLIHNSSSIFSELLKPTSQSIILLTDPEGYILKINGTPESLLQCESLKLAEGVSLAEDSIGTNAIALSILEKKNFQLSGKEHFLDFLWNSTSTATPLFDYNYRLVGVLGILEFQTEAHEYTLNMIKMAANAISDKYWNKLYQKKLNDERQYAFNIMNHLSYGLFAVNLNEKIHWVNDTACRSLNIRRTNLLRKEIKSLILNWQTIKKQLDKDLLIIDEEYTLQVNEAEEKYIVNAYSVKDLGKTMVGYVVTIRPFSQMIKMIGRYSLNNSYFNFENIIGKSDPLKQTLEIAKTASRSPSTILITGESGTGKEVFAQAIHNRSNRSENNFIAINCGAISSSLIESELFGYEEGAFTGALKKGRPGKFELANKGTIFLDEIGEMPLEMQVKLLRAIQEKSITRVGGSREISFDVRIIAASNKDLKFEMERGTFRADLFYRLNVIPIHLPSLRERPEDIPLLMQFFLKQKGQLLTRPIPKIQETTFLHLQQYHWPGNVRELENAMEKLVLFGGDIESASLLPSSKPAIVKEQSPIVNKTLLEVERAAILSTLNSQEWNITKTAEILNIGRNTLYDKIKKYKLKP